MRQLTPFFILLCACLFLATAQSKQLVIDLSKGAPDTVTMHKADTVKLILNENPTTGYSWRVMRKHKHDEKNLVGDMLEVLAEEYESDPNPKGFCGVGGKKVIVIEAVKEGQEDLKLVYCRPWEIEQVLDNEDNIDWEKAASQGIVLMDKTIKVQVVSDEEMQ